MVFCVASSFVRLLSQTATEWRVPSDASLIRSPLLATSGGGVLRESEDAGDETDEDGGCSGFRRLEGVTGGVNSCGGKGGDSVGRSRAPG